MEYTKKEYYEHNFSIQNNEFKLTVLLKNNKLSECYMYSKSKISPLQRAFVFTGKKSLKEMESFTKELTKVINYIKEVV